MAAGQGDTLYLNALGEYTRDGEPDVERIRATLTSLRQAAGDAGPATRDALDAARELMHIYELTYAKLARYRRELVAAQEDLLNIRGALSPADRPERRIPMDLGKQLAAVIEWLLHDREQLIEQIHSTPKGQTLP